eukprot:TRINITY_DN1910_c0_g3_i1.p1 TRINITY_DN1910_c0_g3~~TRINITY_DN1910_c0_g3_i1.p1  ORF type:complete len:178 (-),score=23.91 TRINITY_DN1910_c0_g3_i1:25-558(-)
MYLPLPLSLAFSLFLSPFPVLSHSPRVLIPATRLRVLTSLSLSLSLLSPDKLRELRRRIDPQDLPLGQRIGLYVSSFLELLWMFILQSAYVIMLLIIYIVAVQSISFIHAGYMLVLMLCCVSPYWARRMWKSVVALFEISIVLRLWYQVRPFDNVSEVRLICHLIHLSVDLPFPSSS